jgi:hypothetical protein
MPGYVGEFVDGYTLEGYIEATRVHEAVSFTYRPATRLETVKHDAQVRIALRNEDTDPEAAVKAEKLACEFVAARLKSWDLKINGVHDAQINSESMGRVNAALFNRIYRILRGADVSDPKPDGTTLTNDSQMTKN